MAEIKNFPNNVDEYIGAEDVMKWLHGRTSGVFGADGNLAVTVSDGMTVNVSDGVGWLSNSDGDGTVFWNDTKEQSGSPLALTLSIANATMPRIDRIVVSWETVDYAARPTIEVLTGTPSVSPQAPALTNNQLKRQISLAQIYVDTAVSNLTADNITDERLDGSVCGLVTDWITIDTTVMQGQFSAFLAQIQTELAQLHAGTASMTKAEYDPDGSISTAGGIAAAIENSQKELDPEGAVAEAGGVPDYVTNEISAVEKTITSVSKRVTNLENDIEALASATVTLPASGWSSSVPYTQTITYYGMTADWKPGIPSIPKSGTVNVTTSLAELEALRCINAISSGTNALTFMCFEDKPTTTITVDVPGQLIEG